MHISALLVAALGIAPLISAQLNTLARAAGKKYFGTVTDNWKLSNNSQYLSIVSDNHEFGQLTPENGMKVGLQRYYLVA